MNYCHNCGFKVPLGTEKFCPNCGFNLQGGIVTREDSISTNIHDTGGDAFGVGVEGQKNVIGKEFAYTREGHAIVININNPSSQEFLEIFKNIISIPTQVEQTSTISKEDIKTKLEES